MKQCPPIYKTLPGYLKETRKNRCWMLPSPRTDDDKRNPYWPNHVHAGNGFIGLGECTRQLNRGIFDEHCTVKIDDALKNLRIRIGKRIVSMSIPGVRTEFPFFDGMKPRTDKVWAHAKLSDSKFPYLVVNTVNLYWGQKRPAAQQLFVLDQFNTDFSFYPSLVLILFKKRGNWFALVSMSKTWFEWNDKSSYGASISHEFVTNLVKTGHYYRLGI